MMCSELLALAILAEFPLHLAGAHREREGADFPERPAIHGVFGGHRRVSAIRLVVLHETLLLRREHLGIIRDHRLALEDHRAVIGGCEHRVGGVHPVRRDRAVHLVHLEGAFRVGGEIRGLLILVMQVHLDAVAEEQEGVEPDVRLAGGIDRDQPA